MKNFELNKDLWFWRTANGMTKTGQQQPHSEKKQDLPWLQKNYKIALTPVQSIKNPDTLKQAIFLNIISLKEAAFKKKTVKNVETGYS
ncbi:hypothetical protein [Sinomicrobium sp. M5D2P17]